MTLSLNSASMSSAEMSSGPSLCFWLISVSVLVRSTSVRLPSDSESKRMDRCGGEPLDGSGEAVGGEKAGTCGARSDTVGFEGLSTP